MKKPSSALAIITGLALLYSQLGIAQVQASEFRPKGYNVDERQNPDGSITSEFTQKIQNFINVDGQWQDINRNPKKVGSSFEITDAPFRLVLPERANGVIRFESTNRYDFATGNVRNDPSFGKNRTFPTAVNSLGVVTESGVRYAGAFPDINASLVIETDTDETRYLVEWNSIPTPCIGNPSATFSIPFEQIADGNIRPKARGVNLGKREVATDEIVYSVNEFRAISTEQARIWDASRKSSPIEILGRFDGTKGVFRKVIPCSFFSGVTYPVRTDDTDTFYPNPNVETESTDGYIAYANLSWATARAASSGDTAPDSGTTMYAYSGKGGDSFFGISRTVLLFDTSSIADTNTISSATLSVWALAKDDDENDANAYITVVTSTPASNTGLVTDDFDQFGTTKQSDDLDITSVTTSAHNTFTFTVLSNISKTGVSKFGVREGHDVDNATPDAGLNAWSEVDIASADTAGTSNDPKLVVVHASASRPKTIIIIQHDFTKPEELIADIA